MPHLDTGNIGFTIGCTRLVVLMTLGRALSMEAWWPSELPGERDSELLAVRGSAS